MLSGRWRPKVGERVVIIEEHRGATVLAEFPGDRFRVEPDVEGDGILVPTVEQPVHHVSELRPEYPATEP